MALIYVRSGAASPTSPYTTWGTAAATLQDAINNASPTNADTIWVAPDHAESVGSTQTWVCPLTPGLRIMCAASNTTAPPTGLATTASLTTTSNFNQQMTGFAYVYGLNFNVGTTGNPTLIFGTSSGVNPSGITLENCGLALISTGATALMQFGSTLSGGLGAGSPFKMIGCTLRFSNVGQYMRIYSANVLFQEVTFHPSSSIPTTVFQIGTSTGVHTNIEFRGCALNGKAYTNLFTVNGFQSASRTVLRNCLLATGSNLYTGTLTLPGGHSIKVHDCSSTDGYFNFQEHSAQGIAREEWVVRRTDGAESSDTTTYSIKMTGTANASELYPLMTPEISVWNNIIDVPLNIVMEILRDSTTNLQNDDIWIEAFHPDEADTSYSSIATNGRINQLSTASDHATSTIPWTTTGITNVRKQKMELTIVASKVGFISIRACLAINTTVYVDVPTITE